MLLLDNANAVEHQLQRIYVTPKKHFHGFGNP